MEETLKNVLHEAIQTSLYIVLTRPVGHGYVFSMAVGTIGEWLKLVPFLLGDKRLILRGGGWQFFKVDILAVKYLKINILAWSLQK